MSERKELQRRTFTKNKSSKSRDGKRENFLQLYNRTCHVIFYYSFECCRNRKDAEVIMRDAYIYMFDHIAELRNAESVDKWQQECVQKAFRGLLRSRILMLVEDGSTYTMSSTISESLKEDIWERITKTSDIDPWRLIPIPGKSTIFSVLADQTMSDMRYMTPLDIFKSAVTIVLGVAVVITAIVLGIGYIRDLRAGALDPMEEVFMDERRYDEFIITEAESVDYGEVDKLFSEAAKLDVNEEGKHITYKFPSTIGNTAGTPTFLPPYESNEQDAQRIEINMKLTEIINSVITDDMSDFAKLKALYNYVGSHSTYQEYEMSGEDQLSLLVDYFNYNGGTSQHYAAVLAALIEAAGYRCDVVSGSFVLNRDTEFQRQVRHYWNRMSLNGIVYYLDVEADSNADGTEVRDYYFMAADGNSRWEIYMRDHD